MNAQQQIAMLLAMRAQLEAMHATISAALVSLEMVEAESDGDCRHPTDKRVNTTVQGGPTRFLCLVCNTEVSINEKEDD